MANQITGKILYIYPTQQITTKEGKPFFRRSLVLDMTRFDPYTGERGFENTPMLDFAGDQCQELDKYTVGQIVTVSFDVQGSRYTNADGKEQIYTRIRPYRIELRKLRSEQQAATQQAPQLQASQPQAPQQPVQHAPQQANQQAWAPPQVDAYGNPVSKDPLPF